MTKTPLEQWTEASEVNTKLFAEEELILEVTEVIWEALERRNWTKAKLAESLGTSKSYVTQLLNGGRNITLRTLADIALVLGVQAKIRLYDKSEAGEWEYAEAVVTSKTPRFFQPVDAANEQWSELKAA